MLDLARFPRLTALTFTLFAALAGLTAHASPRDPYAPPPFDLRGQALVPSNFLTERLRIRLDVAARTAVGYAQIDFETWEPGFPLLDLVNPATALRLDGQSLDPARLAEVVLPGTVMRALQVNVAPGQPHRLEIEYDLANQVTFTPSGARLGMFMLDVSKERGFLEQYAPANFEFDAFDLKLQLEVIGAGAGQALYTNGRVLRHARNRASGAMWQVEFPTYFRSSSLYVHTSDQAFAVARSVLPGKLRPIPITVYSMDQSMSNEAMKSARKHIAELESKFGPYAHPEFLAYITPTGGGMEYCGATMSSLNALGHELAHSWFARGVMPADGNSGWMDEAIVSWRDSGYPALKDRPDSGSMASFSPYKRTTPRDAYTLGQSVIGHLHYLSTAKGTGMIPVLSELYALRQHKILRTEEFQSFVSSRIGLDLTAIFNRSVFGRGGARRLSPMAPITHPRPYTGAELQRYR